MLTVEQARNLCESLVEKAVKSGADAADAIYAGNQSSSIEVRLGKLDHVDRSEGEEVGIRLFVGQRSANVASSDFSDEALEESIRRALAMAAEAPEDPFAGLAPRELLHSGPLADLDFEDSAEPGPEQLRNRALEAERAALGVAGVTNSSGASAAASAGLVALATSHGFSGAYRATGLSCAVTVVAGEGSDMQRDHAWHSARHLEDLDSAQDLGLMAGERAVARLKPVKPKPGRYPILFDRRVAATLLSHLSAAITGSSVARKSSFLQDRLGSALFASGIEVVDDPLRRRGLRSRPFDGEGLAVDRMKLVSKGVLRSWIADSASARQLGIRPTGHAARGAGGPAGASPSNLYMGPGSRSREELLAAFPQAVLVTELIGQGVNGVTGDYSRGAAGFMVRNGEIAEAVAEITIASNLIDMFASLEPGSDLEFRRGIDAPTLLVPEMTVAAG